MTRNKNKTKNLSNRRIKTNVRKTKLRGAGDYEGPSNYSPLERIEWTLDKLDGKVNTLKANLPKQSTSEIGKLASMAGRSLGNFVGQGELGSMAGSTLARLFGHGDYVVNSNSLMSQMNGPSIPKFSNDARAIRVREREYLGDVVTSGTPGAFNLGSYLLNPTNAVTFPWLSQFAFLFDQWEPHGIVFEFKSTSSEFNGTSQALGTIIMATDYDAYDAQYPNKQLMENSDYACSTKASESLIHGIECEMKERPTRILYTDATGVQPITNSTLGNFQIATQGMSTANVNVGELWISYDISFYKKQLAVITPPISNNYYSASGSLTTQGAAGPYIKAPAVSAANNISVSTIVGTGNRVFFPPTQTSGYYQYTYFVTDGLGVMITSFETPPGLFNCTVTSTESATTVQAGASWMKAIFIQITGPNAYMTISNYPSSTAANYYVTITPCTAYNIL